MENKPLFVMLFIIILISYFIIHESIHKQIYLYDGCTNVNFGMDWKGFYTKCNSAAYIESSTAQLSHSIAEIVGYNLQIILVLVFAYRLTLED